MTTEGLQSDTTHTSSGIPAIGDIPWGSHFCHFYRGRAELVSSLVPYFEMGLNSNQRCLWITAEPFPAAQARMELENRVPHLAGLIEAGKIVILDFKDWYGTGSNGEDVTQAWLRQEQAALADGFEGLRIAGNAGFLSTEHWADFAEYERKVNEIFVGRRIVAFCSYDLSRCGATDIFEVVRNHHFTIDCRDGKWEVMESTLRGLP